MSGENKQHPGRSADFLSRLHDGELAPGERAHFEVHRGHCAECRRAALEFEDALALFRSARSRPPQVDLAGRILRKIQTSSPRPRARFSPRFRADLGWAALLLTGIFALLLSVRRPESPLIVSFPAPAPDAPASEPSGNTAAGETREDRAEIGPLSERRVLPAPARRDPAARDSVAAAEPRAVAPPPPAVAESKDLRDERSAESERARERPALGAESDRAGGTQEEETTASAAAPAPASPLRLSIEAIDGYGSPPALVSQPRMTMPASYRGHEFILHVDSQGKVSQVRPGPSRERKEETARLAAPAPAPVALSELAFKPGNRPRRLLVRFE